MKVIIIGNSAAGTAAVEAIRRSGVNASVTQLTDEVHPLYSRCLVSYYIPGIVDEKGILFRPPDFHKRMNVDLHPGTFVTQILPDRQKVNCRDGKKYEYDKLLIATGSSVKIPSEIPGNIKGVFALRTLDDAIAIKKYIGKVKSAVILGGGLIGMRIADALIKSGIKVYVIIGSDRVLSQMIDFDAAQIILAQLTGKNIEVRTKTGISEVLLKNNVLRGVRTKDGNTIECGLLVVARGVVPNTGLIDNTDIEKKTGIITSPYMQTNIENIFAAGDVAETADLITGEHTINALWTCAVQQGDIAGYNIAGGDKKYDGSMGMNSLNVFDIPVISFGMTTPRGDMGYKELVDNRPGIKRYRKIVIANNRIKGVILAGKIENAGILLSLARKQVDVSSFAGELLDDGFNYGALMKYGGKKEFENYCNT